MTDRRRLNWRQACEHMRCSKAHFYRLVRSGELRMYGAGARYRYVMRADCDKILGRT